MTPRIVAVLCAAAGTVAIAAQAVAPPLGIPDARAREFAIESITATPPSIGQLPVKAFLALPPAGRATAVTAAFTWLKAYSSSAAFEQAYADLREDMKPELEASGSVDEVFKERQAEQARAIEESRQALPSMPAEARAGMEAAIAAMEAQAKNPQMIAALRMSAEMDIKNRQERYNADMAYWTREFPADPKILIARGLQRFLDRSAGVDYDAALLPRDANGLTKFANPEYERKSTEWKQSYRAGREAVTEGRAQAEAWLKTLPAAK